MNTTGYGGKQMRKNVLVLTNDPQKPKLVLTVVGRVNKFATIKPRSISLKGEAGAKAEGSVIIIPEENYPFKIVGSRAQIGTDITFHLEDFSGPEGQGYRLRAENVKKDGGNYTDTIFLKTDNPIKPEIPIRVYGRFYVKTEQSGSADQKKAAIEALLEALKKAKQ